MSDYDRNPSARWGQGATRIGRAEIDQGLRSYMLGVYNNMVVGLALTGAVALGVHLLAVTSDPAQAVGRAGRLMLTNFGVTLYFSPLHWLVMHRLYHLCILWRRLSVSLVSCWGNYFRNTILILHP